MDRKNLAIVLALSIVGGTLAAPAAAAAEPVEDAFSTVEIECSEDVTWFCQTDVVLCDKILWALNQVYEAGGECI